MGQRPPTSEPIYLPNSHSRLTPMAIGDNWDGGPRACNRYKYRFRSVSLARSPGGSWTPFRTKQAEVMQDDGYRFLLARTDGFVAVAAPPLSTRLLITRLWRRCVGAASRRRRIAHEGARRPIRSTPSVAPETSRSIGSLGPQRPSLHARHWPISILVDPVERQAASRFHLLIALGLTLGMRGDRRTSA
jgi:hypothetical protein